MNVYSPYTDITESFTYPDAIDAGTQRATVYYEWGGVVQAEATPTLDTGTTFDLDISDELTDAAGTFNIKWTCDVSGTEHYFWTSYGIVEPYTTELEFVTEYSQFNQAEYLGTPFTNAEKLSRRIIETHCGQSFQFIKNQVMTMDGNGKRRLLLPERLVDFSAVTIAGVDYSSAVEIDPRSKYHLRMLIDVDILDGPIYVREFPEDVTILITGDWGWFSIPWQIQQAARMLTADILTDVAREGHRYNIDKLYQDINRVEFKDTWIETTGNLDVDVLLLDFVHWTLDYVY